MIHTFTNSSWNPYNDLLLKAIVVISIILAGSFSAFSQSPHQTTYRWNGNSNSDYALASNWSPERTRFAADDILVFSKTDTVTIGVLPHNTVARIIILAPAKITFHHSSPSAQILRLCQPRTTSLDIAHNSSVNFTGDKPLHIAIYGGLKVRGALSFNAVASQSISVAENLDGIGGTIAMNGEGLSHVLRLSGENNELSIFHSSADGNSVVNLQREGTQSIFATLNLTNLVVEGSGAKAPRGNLSISKRLLVEDTAKLYSAGNKIMVEQQVLATTY